MHGNDLRLLVRHLDTDCSLTRHRRDDTDTRSTQRKHNIVLQRLYLCYADTGFRHYFVERHSRSDCRFDAINFYAIVTEGCHDPCSVRALLVFVDDRRSFVVIHFQQVQRRELIELQVFTRVVRTEFLQELVRIFRVQIIHIHILYLQVRIVGRVLLFLFNRRQRFVSQRLALSVQDRVRGLRLVFLNRLDSQFKPFVFSFFLTYRFFVYRNVDNHLVIRGVFRLFGRFRCLGIRRFGLALEEVLAPFSESLAFIYKPVVTHNQENNHRRQQDKTRTDLIHITHHPLRRSGSEGSSPEEDAHPVDHVMRKTQGYRSPQYHERAAEEHLQRRYIPEHMHQSERINAHHHNQQ